MKKEILYYKTALGQVPFLKWFNKINDLKLKSILLTNLDRLSLNKAQDIKPLKDGLFELRIHFRAGYRIYFTENKNKQVILLLLGGSKRSQEHDIKRARKYLVQLIKREK